MTDQQTAAPRIVDRVDLAELERLLELAARRAAEIVIGELTDVAEQVGARDIPFTDEKGFSPAWAEGMLRELYTHHRDVFADCVTGFLAEVRAAKKGRPKKEAGE